MQISIPLANGDNGIDNNMGPKAVGANDETGLLHAWEPSKPQVIWADFGTRRSTSAAGLRAAACIGHGRRSEQTAGQSDDLPQRPNPHELVMLEHFPTSYCQTRFGNADRLFELMARATETIQTETFTVIRNHQ